MKQASQKATVFLDELSQRLRSDRNWSQVARDMTQSAEELPATVRGRVALRLLHRLMLSGSGGPELSRVEREVLTVLYFKLVPDVFFDEIDYMSVLSLATDRKEPDWALLMPALQKFSDSMERARQFSGPFQAAYRRFLAAHGTSIPREATAVLRHVLLFFFKMEGAGFEDFMASLVKVEKDRAARLAQSDMSKTEAALRASLAEDARKLVSRTQGKLQEERPRLNRILERLNVPRARTPSVDLGSEAQTPNGRPMVGGVVNYFSGWRLPNGSPEVASYISRLKELEQWTGSSVLELCDAAWVQRCYIKVEGLGRPAAYSQIVFVWESCNHNALLTLQVLLHLASAAGTAPAPSWLVGWAMRSGALEPSAGVSLCERLAELPGSTPDLLPDDFSLCLSRGAMWGMTRWRLERTPRFLSGLALSRPGLADPLNVASSAVKGLELMATPEALNELMRIGEEAHLPAVRKLVEAALNRIAVTRGVDAETLQDMAVDRCGLDPGPSRTWLLRAAGREETRTPARYKLMLWLDARGRIQQQVMDNSNGKATRLPPEEQELYAPVMAQCEAVARTLEQVYETQKWRLQGALSSGRSWSYGAWRDIFGAHPLLSHLASRLLWRVDLVGPPRFFMPDARGEWTDVAGRQVRLHPEATISLAHPASSGHEALGQWQERLVTIMLVQPFKQLFRETWRVLTPEEAQAAVSTRFAGREVPLGALAAGLEQAGWSVGSPGNQKLLELQKDFASHGIRAVLSVRRANDEGTVATQEVTFRGVRNRPGATANMRLGDALQLGQVPAVVFSETMRDVDRALTESLATTLELDEDWNMQLAHNPNLWQQRRQELRHGTWAAAAASRGMLLKQLASAMGLGGRLSLDGALAVVRGPQSVYAVHLGSGQVFRENNGERLDMHLPQALMERVYLPFEDEEPLTRQVVGKVVLLANEELPAEQAARG
ncbi:MAG: DUF4132 domain-containing protein [Candidatus Xenobia bacterium]